jgi:hypothetical protein
MTDKVNSRPIKFFGWLATIVMIVVGLATIYSLF